MLRIIKPERLTPLYSWIDTEFLDICEEGLWKEGIFLEYWENDVLNFKFSYVEDVITVYAGDFISDYSEEEVRIFFYSNVTDKNVYSWVKDNVEISVLDTRSSDDKNIYEIWKYDYGYCNWDNFGESELFSRYHEYLIQNSVEIRCLPNNWGNTIKIYCPTEKLRLEEKNYWINLCLTKLYVDGEYKRSNKKSK